LVSKEFGKPPATPTLLLLKLNTPNKLKMRRTQLELLEEFKLMEDLFTIHQLLKSIILISHKQSQKNQKQKPQMRAEKSSSNMSKMLLTLLKLKILKKILEPPKLPRWTLKTSRILSMRKPESDPAELP